ncbi:RING finger protein 150 [Poecilia latipinna]|uniref:RING finger protein 150 n=2 Tax=Poecilia TaxID=8080 RepID=A0A087YIL1_POEFO|nr:PREDICTED: RING finger protein 150-like [Poecilia formosa]XP_014867175.1 PREDICTED: RING finger protein 150-like [Poecilia mexicana]XP_014913089.1 PREDICTED: RING finger protein 150-like [Poecilia latipinna]
MAPGSLVAACRSLALSTWLLSFCFVHLLCLDFTVAEREEWYTAFVNITYMDPATSEVRTEKTECGRYGEHSPKRDAKGVVVLPASPLDRQACDPHTRFVVPSQAAAGWIALIAHGNCTTKDKIRHAAAHNASAVVIFNVGSTNPNDTITMRHQGTGEVVVIMIPEPKGREVVSLLERNITVTMTITIGTRNLQKYVSRTSVVFVSISFIVLMIISLAWLVFYYIQRFRYANARDRNQRRLGDAAKKAISKLQVRTIRKGDQETEADFDNCAVCIEGYRPNDVVRILPCRHLFHKSCVDPWLLDHRTCPMCKMNILKALGIALNADCLDDLPLDYDLALGGGVGMGGVGALALEAVASGASSDGTLSEGGSSVVLDPGVRRVGLPQDYQDLDPLRDSPVTATTDTHTGELQPMASSASVASLVIAVETGLSDEEGSMDRPHLGAKS